MQPSKIAVLPAALANQIAAGEVVERPASAIKELVENALDAGATRCDVSVVGGGITRLTVKDNGSGMSASDAELSLLRHATSKLQRFEELSQLTSFGFRGEALPSIASVSRFVLRTRGAASDAGIELSVDAGATAIGRPLAMAQGTEIEVNDLFYNVPARRKFLRSSGTESGYISETLEAAALARPEVSFTLERDGRKAREWLRVSQRAQRVAQVLGDDDLAECRGERGPLRVEAFLDRPERARAAGSAVRFLCNGRPIRDRALLHAVTQSYGSVLERGRYPRGVIYLELPPELVDVNVHPQKSEVRFADGRAVCDALFQILSGELGQAFGLPAVAPNRWADRNGEGRTLKVSDARPSANSDSSGVSGLGESRAATDSAGSSSAAYGAGSAGANYSAVSSSAAHSGMSNRADWNKPTPAALSSGEAGFSKAGFGKAADVETERFAVSSGDTAHHLTRAGGATSDGVRSNSTVTSDVSAQRSPAANAPLRTLFDVAPPQSPEGRADGGPAQPARRLAEDGAPSAWSKLRYAGQLRQTFLVCEDDSGYYLLDQHAAAERVNFDRLKRAYLSQNTRSQALLFPAVVAATLEQRELVDSHASEISRLGFEIQSRGETNVSVHRVPALLQHVAPERLVTELLRELSRRDREFSERVDLALATLACHGSLRAGQNVTDSEARALLIAMDEVEFAGHCPHGRPVVAFTPWSELERKVGRR